MGKVVLAAVRKTRGLSLRELAALCRQESGGEGMGTTHVCAYLMGKRPIGSVHFRILCKVLRVKPEDVMVSVFLAGRKDEGIAA